MLLVDSDTMVCRHLSKHAQIIAQSLKSIEGHAKQATLGGHMLSTFKEEEEEEEEASSQTRKENFWLERSALERD